MGSFCLYYTLKREKITFYLQKKTASRSLEAVFMFNIPQIHQNEMIVPWLERVAAFNGHNSFKDFFLYMFSAKDPRPTKRMNLEIPDFDRFEPALRYLIKYGNLDSAKDYEEMIMNHTLFPFYYSFEIKDNHSPEEWAGKPLKESPALMKYDMVSGKYHKETHCLTSPFSLSEIRYCPECMKEDLKKYGFASSRVQHNMPYVHACYIHGCGLITFPGGKPDLLAAHYSCDPAPNNLEYARFAADYLEYTKTFPDIYYGKILHYIDLIKYRMCLSNKNLLRRISAAEYINSPYLFFPPGTDYEDPPFHSLRKDSFFAEDCDYNNRTVPVILCCLFYLFGDVKTFASCLKEFPTDTTLKYQTYPYKRYVVQANYNATKIMISRLGNLQCGLLHILFSENNPFDDVLVLTHRLCGREFQLTKKQLLAGERCPCQGKRMPLHALRGKILKRSRGSVRVYPVDSGYMLVRKPNPSKQEPPRFEYDFLASELSRRDYSPLFDWNRTRLPETRARQKKELEERTKDFITKSRDTILSLSDIRKALSGHTFSLLDFSEREGVISEVIRGSPYCEFISAQRVHFHGPRHTLEDKEVTT